MLKSPSFSEELKLLDNTFSIKQKIQIRPLKNILTFKIDLAVRISNSYSI
ncbi:hypothetical protein M2408_001292 [Sphingobacterium sp. BIGb0165]|nr:hypothetical protein [Sphingobacterium sp. BIGb0165]